MKKILGGLIFLVILSSCTSPKSEMIGNINVSRKGTYNDLVFDTQKGDVLNVMRLQDSSVSRATFKNMKEFYSKNDEVLYEGEKIAVYKYRNQYIYIYWNFSKYFTYKTHDKKLTDLKFEELSNALVIKKIKNGLTFLKLINKFNERN